MDTLELVITDGAKQASLASDRAPSTLAHQVATALEELGLHKGASRLPMIVGFAVLAHRHVLRLLAEVQRKENGIVVRQSIHPDSKDLLPPIRWLAERHAAPPAPVRRPSTRPALEAELAALKERVTKLETDLARAKSGKEKAASEELGIPAEDLVTKEAASGSGR